MFDHKLLSLLHYCYFNWSTGSMKLQVLSLFVSLIAGVQAKLVPFHQQLKLSDAMDTSSANRTTNAQLSDDGTLLVTLVPSSGSSKTLNLYQLDTEKQTWDLQDRIHNIDADLYSLAHDKVAVLGNGTIQVYAFKTDSGDANGGRLLPQGSPIRVDNNNNTGTSTNYCSSLQLGINTQDFIAVGCPFANNSRGQVSIYIRMKDLSWTLVATLQGEQPGDGFGRNVVLDDTRKGSRLFRIAIASMNRMQVYEMDASRVQQPLQQLGPDIVWKGELLELTATATGGTVEDNVPVCLLRSNIGTVLKLVTLNESQTGWLELFQFAESTTADSDSPVSAVLTKDASRIITCDTQNGITVYQLSSGWVFRPIWSDSSVYSCDNLASNAVGSLVVVTQHERELEPSEVLVSLLDHSPFCAAPSSSLQQNTEATSTAVFLERDRCLPRDMKGAWIETQDKCGSSVQVVKGTYLPCIWREELPTFAPTGSPSTAAPSLSDSLSTNIDNVSSATAWPDASNATTSPTSAPSATPTLAQPSTSPSLVPLQATGCRVGNLQGACLSEQEPLIQGMSLLLRIATTQQDDAAVVEVTWLVLEQGSSRVVLRDSDDIYLEDKTEVSCHEGGCLVSVPTVNNLFFEAENVEEIMTVRGRVLVELASTAPSSGKRLLRAQRHLVQEAMNFVLDVPLQMGNGTSGQAGQGEGAAGDKSKIMDWLVWIVLVCVVLLAAGYCWFQWASKRDEPAFNSK